MEPEVIEKTIMELADNMAAAASSTGAHSYDSLIKSREELKDALHKVFERRKK